MQHISVLSKIITIIIKFNNIYINKHIFLSKKKENYEYLKISNNFSIKK